jgi:hypothetical protein
MPTALQFICKKCTSLSNVQAFQRTLDGAYFCVCEECGAKNTIVHSGATPSQPGLLPVIGVIQ